LFASKGEDEVSWFQEHPAPSLEMVARAGVGLEARIIDIGGGASRLVDALLAKGWRNLAALDLSQAALATAKRRLGEWASAVRWIVADVTTWRPEPAAYDVWHDRAAFHFLVDPGDRAAYVARLTEAVKSGGCAGRAAKVQRAARRALRRRGPRRDDRGRLRAGRDPPRQSEDALELGAAVSVQLLRRR
jgi:trans-aconitate methyltransferase